MARTVNSLLPLHLLVNPEIKHDNPDCWWIHAMAGDVLSLFTWAPISLPMVGWEKRNHPRVYQLSTIRKRFEREKRMDRKRME